MQGNASFLQGMENVRNVNAKKEMTGKCKQWKLQEMKNARIGKCKEMRLTITRFIIMHTLLNFIR